MKVWKTSKGHFLVECPKCSSRGRPARVDVVTNIDPKSTEAWKVHLGKATIIRDKYQATLRTLVKLQQSKQLTRIDAAAKIKDLAVTHAVNLKQLMDGAPDLKNNAIYKVKVCPWCKNEDEATIEQLPDGVLEPPEWLPEKVRAS